MMRDDPAAAPTDADLVAYLDGELSPGDSVRIGQRLASDDKLAARLDHLMRGGRTFCEAFEPLLAEAPVDRLDAMLEATLARPTSPPRLGTGLRALALHSWPAAAAVAAILMLTGAGLDRLAVAPLRTVLLAPGSRMDASEDWRRAVAQYLSLYTRDTLGAIALGGNPSGLELASLGRRLGLPLTPERVDLTDLALKRADLYDYDGQPLAFLAYLDPQDGPVALCITAGPGGSDAQRIEQRRGMAVVYWSQGHHRFMLIGHAPSTRLQALATTVAGRFDAKADDGG